MGDVQRDTANTYLFVLQTPAKETLRERKKEGEKEGTNSCTNDNPQMFAI